MAQIVICAGISLIPYIRPVGAFQLANVLRSHGYTVQVIDQFPWIAHCGVDQVEKLFDKFIGPETLWVGFSTTWFRRIKPAPDGRGMVTLVEQNIQEVVDNTLVMTVEEINHIKGKLLGKYPKLKFVAGGARAQMGREGLLKPLIDVYIEGYADSAVVDFTRWCEDPSTPLQTVINGDGSIGIRNDPKASKFDYNNFKFTWAPEDLVNPGEALPMEIARGCMFNCAFCSYPLNGRRKMDYLKDPAILREQFEENYEKYGTTNYFFLDDTFNDSPLKLQILYDQVFSKLPFKVGFSAFMRLDLMHAHPDTIDLLAASGVNGAQFGIESLNYEANKTIGKGIARDRIYDTLMKIREKWGNAVVDSQFILGLPNDDEASIRDWVSDLLHPDYPLDFVKLDPLMLSNQGTKTKTWISQFELNPEKFGYSFPDSSNPLHWVNNTGLSQLDAIRIKKDFEGDIEGLTKNNDKMAWVIYHGSKNIGIQEEILDKKRAGRLPTITKMDYMARMTFVKKYISKLLAL